MGLITRSDLVAPPRRKVVLVDHAEQAQSVIGIGEAEILEILDHHHIGSIETRVPVTATFDPVGSTATLVVERFRQNGLEPSRPTAMMLLGAVLSDTVILNSATTTERDHAVVATWSGRWPWTPVSSAARCSSQPPTCRGSAPTRSSAATPSAIRSAVTRRSASPRWRWSARRLLERREELLDALRRERESKELALYALMVTDVLAHATEMLVAGDTAAVARSFGVDADDGTIELPGVMSRKKEVAPKLMTAL